MSSTLLVILIILCFSSSLACNARLLEINDPKEIGPKGTVHINGKLSVSISKSKLNTHETSASPITSKNKKTPEGLLRSEKHADGATSVVGVTGDDEIPKSISHIIQLQHSIKLKGIENLECRRQLMLLESAPNGDNAEAENIVVMDYAQPHRKPPIHNEKP